MEEENFAEAEKRVREALDIKYKTQTKELLFHKLECLEKLGVILQRQRRFDEAEANYKQSITLRKEVKCVEDPAVYCNLGTIGITRACIHLTQVSFVLHSNNEVRLLISYVTNTKAREILNETHHSKQLAKQAKSDAEVLLKEAKILLHQARQHVRMAIHLCEGSTTPNSQTPVGRCFLTKRNPLLY